MAFSCNFLDVVPDNIPTIDHAFQNRTEAMNYLYGLLGGMPDVGNYTADPALAGSDELWMSEGTYSGGTRTLTRLLRGGYQSPTNPLANYWSSEQNSYATNGGKHLWTTISDCNFFLENIHKPYDLLERERDKWIGEALFVKAYCHFWLLRQYGPIPLIRENLLISETDQMRRYREPVDDVCEYIVSLLDQAIELLPLQLESETEEMGRPNKCIAAALKAKTLALVASPLFNCNPDYADYRDNRGVQLFPQDKSFEKNKWKVAADATKEAIDLAHEAFHRLYDVHTDFQTAVALSEETLLAMQVRGAATERWNSEIIWGDSRTGSHGVLQRFCFPYLIEAHQTGSSGLQNWSPSLRMAEQFYTKNGIPIEDDADWAEKDVWNLRRATEDDRQYIRQGNQTIELHFDREARFYGSLFFDEGTFFGNGNLTTDNTSSYMNLLIQQFKVDQLNQGNENGLRYTRTGYLCKKLVNCRTYASLTANSFTYVAYAFPVIRLADLYLLYAEALNEWKDAPDNEVYEYIDLVRERTGLKGVVESWRDHAIAGKKNLPLTQAGMREIIRRERMNELAFEGPRYWDIRRWKVAEDYLNRPLRVLNLLGKSAVDFYQEVVLFNPVFEKKDYFTPIRTEVLLNNTNLLQSPYW